MAVFTCLWCVDMNYEQSCVFYCAYIFDFLLYFCWGWYGLGYNNGWYWPAIIFIIFSFCLLAMAIFALIQIFTRSNGAAGRLQTYIKWRMISIIALVIAGIVMFILWIIFGAANGYQSGYYIGWAFSSALPFLFDAAILHMYHKTFASNQVQ